MRVRPVLPGGDELLTRVLGAIVAPSEEQRQVLPVADCIVPGCRRPRSHHSPGRVTNQPLSSRSRR